MDTTLGIDLGSHNLVCFPGVAFSLYILVPDNYWFVQFFWLLWKGWSTCLLSYVNFISLLIS